MRILFFVEPVVFRDNPVFLAPHLAWAAALVAASAGADHFALASSAALCRHWQLHHAAYAPLPCFELDAQSAVAPFAGRSADYARALYGDPQPGSPLCDELARVRSRFAPDLVVLTSQNCFAESAFSGLPMLRIEQAPLPRWEQPLRMSLDPGGHQLHAIIETHADRIRRFPLSPAEHAAMRDLIAAVVQHVQTADPRAAPAADAVRVLAQGAPVALFALQPPDWVTSEGALGRRAFEPMALLRDWAERLPPGWIGVPTYHPDWRPSAQEEQALLGASARLRLLPAGLSQGTTECLLPVVQGLVTVSSSAAMTAALWRKPVAVVGASPFRAWGCRAVGDLADAPVLTPYEAGSTLAFLCHRYAHRNTRILQEKGYFSGLVRDWLAAPDPVGWFFDRAGLSVTEIAAHFTLPEGFRHAGVG